MSADGTPGATKEDYLKFLKWGINHNNTARRGHFVVWERCRLYVVGEQWLEDNESDWASRLGFSPALKPRQVDDKSWYPMPVQNEMCAPIQNEVARLMGAGSKPYIRPSRSDSRRVKAAELSKEVLSNRLNQLCWVSKQHRAINNMVTYGTMILKSWWELDFTDMVTLPGKGVHSCPDCGAMVGTLTPPVDKAAQFLGDNPLKVPAIQMPSQFSQEDKATVTACLSCDSLQPLVPAQPSPEQAQQTDSLGMPLGDKVPRGDTQISVVAVYDFFPENAGIGLEANDVTEWFEERIESVEWIRKHYLNGYKVKPQVSIDIGRYHPCVGSAAGFVNVDKKDGLFEAHAVVREYHQQPVVVVDDQGNPTINKGRSIVMAGEEIVLLDDDYMIDSENAPGELIPRVVYTITPFEIRDREVWGVSASEYMFSLQDTINTTLSQVQDARHRMGSPKILATEGMDLGFAGFADTGYDGDILYFKPDTSSPMAKPEPFGNIQMPQNWVGEITMAQQAIGKAVGTMDVEVGQAPGKDLTAASAIMYLGEKAAERRKPRIARIKEAFCKIYRHQLQLMQKFYREDRVYSAFGKNDRWVVRSFIGSDLMGETDVQFEDEPYYDARMFRREVIKDGIQLGTVSIDTADAKRKINKELGIPLEINEEQNQQVQCAEEEWFEFYEEMTEPAMSQRSDDPIIHYQVHELSLRSEDGRRMQSDCQFSQVELQMWGWEDKLNALESIEQQLKQPPPQAPLPGPGPGGAPEQGALDPASVQAYQQALATRMQMEQQIQQFPKAPELRVYQIWIQMLTPMFSQPAPLAPGEAPDPNAPARWPQIQRVLRWKAHIEAHYREGQKRASMAQSGVPVPAAPGSAETAAGLVPSPGQVAYAGAGAGPGATTGSGSGGA